MIPKELRKRLDLSWIKNNNVWDAVVYGSIVRGKAEAEDIDIALILGKKASARKKMSLSQEFRHMLSESGLKLDVKAVDMDDFLDEGFLARESIIAEGHSLLRKDSLAERFGFKAVALVEYTLKGLAPAKQKLLYYALQGRGKGEGVLARAGGRIISKGVLAVPTGHYEEIKRLLEKHKVSFSTTFSLQYRMLQ